MILEAPSRFASSVTRSTRRHSVVQLVQKWHLLFKLHSNLVMSQDHWPLKHMWIDSFSTRILSRNDHICTTDTIYNLFLSYTDIPSNPVCPTAYFRMALWSSALKFLRQKHWDRGQDSCIWGSLQCLQHGLWTKSQLCPKHAKAVKMVKQHNIWVIKSPYISRVVVKQCPRDPIQVSMLQSWNGWIFMKLYHGSNWNLLRTWF